MGLRTLVGILRKFWIDKTSREEVSDCMGKVFPVLGLRKVDGNLGWSRARGRGGAGKAARTLAPPTVGVVGNWGRGCLGSLFCPPDGWATESLGLKFDGCPSPAPSWFCGCFLVSALTVPPFAVSNWVSVPGSLCPLLYGCWFWT